MSKDPKLHTSEGNNSLGLAAPSMESDKETMRRLSEQMPRTSVMDAAVKQAVKSLSKNFCFQQQIEPQENEMKNLLGFDENMDASFE